MVGAGVELVKALEHLPERLRRIDPVDRVGRNRADRDRIDDAKRADRDARSAKEIRLGVVDRDERAVRRDHLERLDLSRDVLEALARAVRTGRDRAGDCLAVDVAEVLECNAIRVEHAVEIVEHRASLDLEEP